MNVFFGSTLLATMLALSACTDSDAASVHGPSPEGGNAESCHAVTSVEDAVRIYGSAWNEPDSAARLCALERSLTGSVTYVDPTIDTSSREALADAIAAFQTGAPGAAIVQASALDARDGELRFGWDFQTDGKSVIRGLDYMELADDGTIASIRGYWEPLPTAAPTGALSAYLSAWTAADAESRRSALGDAVATSVRFTSPTASATGVDALVTALPETGAVTLLGTQAYPKFARMEFSVDDGGVATTVTDYLHLDADGKITRIARFSGDLPPL